MKIIIPNDIKLEKEFESSSSLGAPKEAIIKFIQIESEYIQYVKSEKDANILQCQMHPLVQAVHESYCSHLPLVLTPDAIWYCLASGIAIHINKNAENLRNKFVDHDGKKKIEIRRDDFVYGASNPWHEVVDDFCTKIREYTKSGVVDKLEANFTTTSKDARVVSQIVIMDAMQKYFDYCFSTMCGVPEIRLAGEKNDWVDIKKRLNQWTEIIPELKVWVETLNPVLDEFVNVYDDKVDNSFWNEIYKIDGGSGGPYINGWLVLLFPYLKDEHQNKYCFGKKSWKAQRGFFEGLNTTSFDYHMNQVPFTWNYFGNEVDMLFVGGLVGVHVEPTDKALTPVFGYAITEDKKKKQEQFEY